MRLSTRGRRAVTAMTDLALTSGQGPMALQAIARRQHISLSYLEQLFASLRQAGLVDSARGPGGGYTLGRPAREISVADIVLAVDGDWSRGDQDEFEPRHASTTRCDTRAVWADLATRIVDVLRGVSLQGLADDQAARGVTLTTPAPARGIAPRPVSKSVRSNAPNSVFALGSAMAGLA